MLHVGFMAKFKQVFKQIILNLTLLVFLGQSLVAAANPCLQSDKMSGTGLESTMTMDHTNHVDANQVSSDINHCDMPDCDCDLGGCYSVLCASGANTTHRFGPKPIPKLAAQTGFTSSFSTTHNPLIQDSCARISAY